MVAAAPESRLKNQVQVKTLLDSWTGEDGEEAEIEDIKRATPWGIPPNGIPPIVAVRIRPLCGTV